MKLVVMFASVYDNHYVYRFVKGYNKTNKRPPTFSCPRASTSCIVYSDWRKVHSDWDRGSAFNVSVAKSLQDALRATWNKGFSH